jgi:hypothetical protein
MHQILTDFNIHWRHAAREDTKEKQLQYVSSRKKPFRRQHISFKTIHKVEGHNSCLYCRHLTAMCCCTRDGPQSARSVIAGGESGDCRKRKGKLAPDIELCPPETSHLLHHRVPLPLVREPASQRSNLLQHHPRKKIDFE